MESHTFLKHWDEIKLRDKVRYIIKTGKEKTEGADENDAEKDKVMDEVVPNNDPDFEMLRPMLRSSQRLNRLLQLNRCLTYLVNVPQQAIRIKI